LIKKVAEKKDVPDHVFYQCRLGTKYIAPDANIVPDPDFESGVVKIQCGQISELTDDENEAVKRLKISDDGGGAGAGGGSGGIGDSPDLLQKIRDHERKRKRGVDEDGGVVSASAEYYNADFILASAAEVERLWSMAKYILVDQRKGMTPQMFEALLFLKVNERFWNQSLVIDALHHAKTARSEDRLAKIMEQLDIQGDDE
jgi:hypothetical protein